MLKSYAVALRCKEVSTAEYKNIPNTQCQIYLGVCIQSQGIVEMLLYPHTVPLQKKTTKNKQTKFIYLVNHQTFIALHKGFLRMCDCAWYFFTEYYIINIIISGRYLHVHYGDIYRSSNSQSTISFIALHCIALHFIVLCCIIYMYCFTVTSTEGLQQHVLQP